MFEWMDGWMDGVNKGAEKERRKAYSPSALGFPYHLKDWALLKTVDREGSVVGFSQAWEAIP